MTHQGFHQEQPVTQIEASHANVLFLRGLDRIINEGEEIVVQGNKRTIEVQPMVSILHEPCKRVLTIPYRRLNPFFLLAETLWLLSGNSDAEFITYFNPRLKEYLDDYSEYFHGAYGERLQRSGNLAQVDKISPPRINQLQEAYERLRRDFTSRQAVMTIWNPLFDNVNLPTKDTPCNIAVSFKIRNNQLHMSVFNRSNDWIWGYCSTNIVQFSVLQEVLAGALGFDVGRYVQYMDSAHVYLSENPYYLRYKNNDEVLRSANHHHVWGQYDIYKWIEPLEIGVEKDGLTDFLNQAEDAYLFLKDIITGQAKTKSVSANPFLKFTEDALLAWHELHREDGDTLDAVRMIRELPSNDFSAEINRWMFTYLSRKGWEAHSISEVLEIDKWPANIQLYIMHDPGVII